MIDPAAHGLVAPATPPRHVGGPRTVAALLDAPLADDARDAVGLKDEDGIALLIGDVDIAGIVDTHVGGVKEGVVVAQAAQRTRRTLGDGDAVGDELGRRRIVG